jgi:hypothetical protein
MIKKEINIRRKKIPFAAVAVEVGVVFAGESI